jgi:hypothetical protein
MHLSSYHGSYACISIVPTVALTYSTNPAMAGTVTVTATYSEAVDATPDISIDQPGTTDISAVAMTPGAV